MAPPLGQAGSPADKAATSEQALDRPKAVTEHPQTTQSPQEAELTRREALFAQKEQAFQKVILDHQTQHQALMEMMQRFQATVAAVEAGRASQERYALGQAPSPIGTHRSGEQQVAAVGQAKTAEQESVAVGPASSAEQQPGAVGPASSAEQESAAVGSASSAEQQPVAVGSATSAEQEPVSVGSATSAEQEPVAVGTATSAKQQPVAVGLATSAEQESASERPREHHGEEKREAGSGQHQAEKIPPAPVLPSSGSSESENSMSLI